MSSYSPKTPAAFSTCPSCGVVLPERAVLCVSCGYHLQLGKRLSVEQDVPQPHTLSSNPYASPPREASYGRDQIKGLPDFDLTEAAAKEVESLVSDAKFVWVAALIAHCCCQIVGPLMFLWYGYRLWRWKALREQFEELRRPNAFSPNGKLAGDFEEAWLWLAIGMGIGIAHTVLWTIAAISYFVA